MSVTTDQLAHLAAFNVFLGDKLGEGIHRIVFECAIDPTLVVKVEFDERMNFSNAAEWKNWNESRYYQPMADWLAPCVRISPCGRVLLQKRIIPMREDELPDKVPSFLTDLKPGNFGWYENRVVACDYSTLITSANAKRFKKAHWNIDGGITI